jgi:5-methylcytosine-specific restriction protein A
MRWVVAQTLPHPCSRCRRALVPARQNLCTKCEAKAGRGSATARGYDHEWRKVRAAYAALHPFCEPCLRRGRHIPVQIVDHVAPHLGNDALRLDATNLQSMCRSCHATKTHTEADGYYAPRH